MGLFNTDLAILHSSQVLNGSRYAHCNIEFLCHEMNSAISYRAPEYYIKPVISVRQTVHCIPCSLRPLRYGMTGDYIHQVTISGNTVHRHTHSDRLTGATIFPVCPICMSLGTNPASTAALDAPTAYSNKKPF